MDLIGEKMTSLLPGKLSITFLETVNSKSQIYLYNVSDLIHVQMFQDPALVDLLIDDEFIPDPLVYMSKKFEQTVVLAEGKSNI